MHSVPHHPLPIMGSVTGPGFCIGMGLMVALAGAAVGCAPPPATDPPLAADDDGSLVHAALIADATAEQLRAAVSAGIDVDNGYEVWSITYRTQGTDATATVTLPHLPNPETGFPVVANAHGTIGLDDPCRLSGTISGAGFAGLFGARSAIGVAPDYVGLGGPGLHPYLDVQSEGRAVLDALRAARALAAEQGVQASLRVAVVGLSQGGHAALAAAALHQSYAPELDLRAVGAAAPASGYREQWLGIDVAGPHLPLYAMLAHVFAVEAGLPPTEVFQAPFAAVADETFATRCAWSPTFNADEVLLETSMPTEPTALFTDAARDQFTGRAPGAWADEGFSRRRLPDFTTSAAVRIWQGDADSTVLPGATAELVDALRAGGLEVELTLVPDGTHLDTAFGFLASLDRAREQSVAWVQARLE